MYRPVAYYPDQLPMSVIPQKKTTTLGNHHVEGFHDLSTQAREKWGVKNHMNFWTPCSSKFWPGVHLAKKFQLLRNCPTYGDHYKRSSLRIYIYTPAVMEHLILPVS